jgi:hypothetical protein
MSPLDGLFFFRSGSLLGPPRLLAASGVCSTRSVKLWRTAVDVIGVATAVIGYSDICIAVLILTYTLGLSFLLLLFTDTY